MVPAIISTTLISSLAALIPKGLSDAYDYFFGDEVIQVRKVPDKTKLTAQNIEEARKAYAVYCEPHSIYTSQKQLTDTLNAWFRTNKSVAQMMRICRSSDPTDI